MVQYGRGETVFKAARARSRQRKLHRKKDCDALDQVDEANILEKPLPAFPNTERCNVCF